MSEMAAAAGLVLAAVFAWAGLAKLRGIDPARLEALGVPLPRLVAWTLGPFELALALLLMIRPRAAAAVALLVLACFTTVLVRALRRGRRVACGCFGSSGHAPISGVDVGRNVVLGVMAVTALGAGGPVIPGLAAVVGATTGLAAAMVVLSLVELRDRTGRLWRNDLETGPEALP